MKKLRNIRKKKNITIKELAEMINVNESTISLYENQKRQPSIDTLKHIADALGTTTDKLLGRDDETTESSTKSGTNFIKIPIYGKIPPATPITQIDESYIDDYIEMDSKLLRGSTIYFGLKVKGSSMFPEFRSGDILIFRQQDHCENGDYCIVSINHTECTFKKVLKKENGLTLMPLNPDYDPLFFTKKEVATLPVTILGIVREVRRSY
jgi:repressor LexA